MLKPELLNIFSVADVSHQLAEDRSFLALTLAFKRPDLRTLLALEGADREANIFPFVRSSEELERPQIPDAHCAPIPQPDRLQRR